MVQQKLWRVSPFCILPSPLFPRVVLPKASRKMERTPATPKPSPNLKSCQARLTSIPEPGVDEDNTKCLPILAVFRVYANLIYLRNMLPDNLSSSDC